MKEGGTSLNKTFREYNLVFKGLREKMKAYRRWTVEWTPLDAPIGGVVFNRIPLLTNGGWGFANLYVDHSAFMHYPYLVCILFGMLSLHLY